MMISKWLWVLVAAAGQGLAEEAAEKGGKSEFSMRGVKPDQLDVYKRASEGGVFTCLKDGKTIPFSQVNDGYCDCADGSDEPGTSACDQGTFYCENKGFFPLDIAKSLVDDGVCDCCDGSDEREGLCPNTCANLMRKYVEKSVKSNNIIKSGLVLKKEALETARLLRLEMEEKLRTLESDNVVKESTHDAMTRRKDMLVAQDKNGQLYNHLHDRLNSLQALVEDRFAKVQQRDQTLITLEGLLSEMTNTYNPNFNDPAVKRAAQGYLNYATNKDVPEIDTLAIITTIDELRREIDSLPVPSTESFWDPFEEVARKVFQYFVGIHPLDLEQVTLPELERRLDALEAEIKSQKNEIQRLSTDLARDMGPNDILRSQNHVHQGEVGNYIYRLQMNGDLSQVDSKGSSVLIGKFEEVITDDYRLGLRFGSGQRCWNGPIRSATVEFECSTDTAILSVSEREKCSYHVTVATPLGCYEQDLIVI